MPRWDASDYHRHSTAQQAWARELFGKLSLCGSERILDIGSGDGKVTAELASLAPSGRVLGIDRSPQMVSFARDAFPPERHPNLGFDQADARELTFDSEFDLVFSNATLHWIIDHRPVLAGIARALTPGGRFVAQMAGAGNAAPVVEQVQGLCAEAEWHELFQGFAFPYGFHGTHEYRGWLCEAGLEAKRVDLFPRDMLQKGSAGLTGWVRTTWLPYTQRVPEDRREAFIATLVARYVEAHPPDAEGFVHVPMVRLEVEAVRPALAGRQTTPACPV
jgi:trans-aconitate 2-methyltransferase